jgi:hypothetical protein
MNAQRRSLGHKLTSFALLGSLSACASTTLIQSEPPGAKLYLNGEPVGYTPYAMTDTKIVGSTTTVQLEMPGYMVTTGTITRNEEFDVGACIGGVLLLFPFLWIQGYKPTHTFELRPMSAAPAGYPAGQYYVPYNQGAPWPAPPPVAPAPGVPQSAPAEPYPPPAQPAPPDAR